jgi:hypothetical protein
MPGGAILPEPLTSNPFDGQWPIEGLNEGTDCQVFNRNLTAWSENTRPAKEAMIVMFSPAPTVMMFSPVVTVTGPCSFGYRCKDR